MQHHHNHAPTSRGWATIIVICSILFGLAGLWWFSNTIIMFKSGEHYSGFQCLLVTIIMGGLCLSGFRAVQSGNSIVAGQHLRFITACAAVYMVILIVNFLVATLQRDCRDELGWDGKLDCSNLQVAILVGLFFVGIISLIAWSCVACARAYYHATLSDEEASLGGVPMQAMSGASHVVYGQPMMQAQVVQQPAFVTYAPQPQVIIQQPMAQAQYVVPAGLQ